MKIYEIEQAILDCIDQETGEIIDEERLTALNMERNKKISGVICWYKELRAEAEAIKNEKQALAYRQKVCENQADRLKNWINYTLGGEKFSDARGSVSYRKSSSVEFVENFNYNNLPDDLKKVTVEPKKDEIKKAISDGIEIEGCSVIDKTNIIIK